jgi:hypothetical protein
MWASLGKSCPQQTQSFLAQAESGPPSATWHSIVPAQGVPIGMEREWVGMRGRSIACCLIFFFSLVFFCGTGAWTQASTWATTPALQSFPSLWQTLFEGHVAESPEILMHVAGKTPVYKDYNEASGHVKSCLLPSLLWLSTCRYSSGRKHFKPYGSRWWSKG